MKKFTLLDDKTVGRILKIYRVSNHMTQKTVADYLDVARSTYAKYETMRMPELDIIVKLAALYNTSLDDFISPFFDGGAEMITSASSPDDESLIVNKNEKKLLEYYRSSVRKADILKAAEEIYNADIEIINDVQE